VVAHQEIHGKVGCGCDNTSETKVFHWMVSYVAGSHFEVKRQYKPGILGVGGGQLSVDMAVIDTNSHEAVLFVEIDGGHHFKREFFSSTKRNSTPEHDLKKEKLGVPMLRVEQRTVEKWRMPLVEWLQTKIDLVTSGNFDSSVCCYSDGKHYETGLYATLRGV